LVVHTAHEAAAAEQIRSAFPTGSIVGAGGGRVEVMVPHEEFHASAAFEMLAQLTAEIDPEASIAIEPPNLTSVFLSFAEAQEAIERGGNL
jgi:hypothetical protein